MVTDNFSKKEIESIESNCHKWRKILDSKCPLSDLVKIESLTESINQIQTIVTNASEELIYSTNHPSLNNIIAQHTDNGIKKIKFGVGLISLFDVQNYWMDNQGSVKYQYYLGNQQLWEKQAIMQELNWEDIKKTICRGVNIGTRLFRGRNTTSMLLSSGDKIYNGINGIRIVAGYRSVKGLSNEITKETENLLTDKDSFPQIYALISKDLKPLGFLQLCIKGLCPKNFEEEIFNTTYKIYPERFYSENTDIYNDPDRSRLVFNNEHYVTRVYELIDVLCSEFLLYVIGLTQKVIEHHYYHEGIKKYFPDSFLNATKISPVEGESDYYKNSIWSSSINEIRQCLKYARFSPSDIALGIITSIWNELPEMRKLQLNNSAQVEKTLFWLSNYREHFVHTLKVFLIGLRIIDELYTKKYLVDHRGHIEKLWMFVATVHDWSIPIEKLPELQGQFWKKFLHGDDDEEKHEYENILTSQADDIFLRSTILDNHMAEYMHLLHFEDIEKPIKNPMDLYLHHRNVESMGRLHSESLAEIIPMRDHGVASALWFLNRVFLCDKNCKKYVDNQCGERAPGMTCSKAEKEINDLKLQDYFEIAHAVFFHNFLLKMNDKSPKKEPVKDYSLNINFKKWPLTFLLALSDFVQDEGRPSSPGSDERANGFIEEINFNQESNELRIKIDYFWPNENCYPGIPLATTKCKSRDDKRLQKAHCFGEKEGQKKCHYTYESCEKVKKVNEMYEKLTKRLSGLNVVFEIAPDVIKKDKRYHKIECKSRD